MRESPDIANALRQFYDRNTANDQASFHKVVSADEAVTIIGSSAREWFEGQAAARAAFGLEQVKIDAGQIKAWEEGTAGWAINTPRFIFPDGSVLRLRMSTVFVKEDGGWRLVHLHGSTPVPDEIYMEHQDAWWPA